jgi:hypothetical protein
MYKRNDNKERLGPILCGNASEQQDLRSVTIQADEPPGFVDKEKWLERGERFPYSANDRRCYEATNYGGTGRTPTGNRTTHTNGCITLCVVDNKLLCGNASGQVNQQSVTIQADEPPGFVDKEKWLAHGERFPHGTNGRRCCEAVSCEKAGHAQTGCAGRCGTHRMTNDKLLCNNASGQQDQRSVTIQADEPPGFVDKEKWLAHGGKFFRDADGRRCREAVCCGRFDCAQAGRTAAHTGRRKTVPTTPCAPLCGLGTGWVATLPLTAVLPRLDGLRGTKEKAG